MTAAAGGNPVSCRLSLQKQKTPEPRSIPAMTMHSTTILRSLVFVVASGAALAATPAAAQRASLADRVASLEQQAASNRGNVDLLHQVTQTKNEMQALRSQPEELQRKNEQLESTNRAQYLDLDGRLNRIEGGVSPPVPAPASVPAAPPRSEHRRVGTRCGR